MVNISAEWLIAASSAEYCVIMVDGGECGFIVWLMEDIGWLTLRFPDAMQFTFLSSGLCQEMILQVFGSFATEHV